MKSQNLRKYKQDYSSSFDDRTLVDKAYVDRIPAITGEPTGFTNNTNITVTYDPTARTITLTGTFKAYYKGVEVTALTNGWVSQAHTAANGTYFLRYDGTQFLFNTTPWDFGDIMIALAYRDGANFCLREVHGLMQKEVHEELHRTIGTYLKSGGDISGYILNSTVATNRRPQISETVICDEDIATTLAALTTNAYSWVYLSGANTTNLTVDNTEIINQSANVPFYNQFTGGVWQQTAMTNNNYAKIFVMALPVTANADYQKKRFVFIQPQTQNATLATVQALTPSSINLGTMSSALAEYNYFGEIIIRYTAGNWQLISVNKLTGTKVTQVSTPAGNYLSSVATDGTLTGDGTSSNPLSLNMLSGTGSPEGVVNATKVLQFYMDTVVNSDGGHDIYVAVTTTGKRQKLFVSPNS